MMMMMMMMMMMKEEFLRTSSIESMWSRYDENAETQEADRPIGRIHQKRQNYHYLRDRVI